MEYEQMTIEGFEKRTAALEQSLSEMEKRLAAMEERLKQQERKSHRAHQFQQLQDSEIEKLKKIILDLANDAPLQTRGDAAAISKEEAYRRFGECGIGKVTAMRALRKTGAIRLDKSGRNTNSIWLGGKNQRVIIVQFDD